jgi:hypothetical protein
MVAILGMYTISHDVYSKFIKNKTIDMTEPAVTQFINKLTDNYIALSSVMHISDG